MIILTVGVLLISSIASELDVTVLTHNVGGMFGKSFIIDSDRLAFFEGKGKNYFPSSAGSIHIINLQELSELKFTSVFKAARKQIYAGYEKPLKPFISSTNDSLWVERGRLTRVLTDDRYNCEYLQFFVMATVVCVKEEGKNKVRIRSGESFLTNYFGDNIDKYVYGSYLVGQKGGFITEIKVGDKYLLNVNVHFDAFKPEKRKEHLAKVKEFVEAHSQKLQTEENVPSENIWYWMNGDFNSRLTNEEKEELDQLDAKDKEKLDNLDAKDEEEPDDQVIGGRVYNYMNMDKEIEEYRKDHLSEHNLGELTINFVPTYKLKVGECENKLLRFMMCKPGNSPDNCQLDECYKKDDQDKPKFAYTDRFFFQTPVPDFIKREEDEDENSEPFESNYMVTDTESSYSDHLIVLTEFSLNIDSLDELDTVEQQDALEAEAQDFYDLPDEEKISQTRIELQGMKEESERFLASDKANDYTNKAREEISELISKYDQLLNMEDEDLLMYINGENDFGIVLERNYRRRLII